MRHARRLVRVHRCSGGRSEGGGPDPRPGPGEVRVRIHVSAVNLGDTKKRAGSFGPAAFPMIIPHSDGAV
jgi:NADPH2:quinone reductase